MITLKDWNNPMNPVRLSTTCPLCLQNKDRGLIVCWPCHSLQKHHNDGNYSKAAQRKIATAMKSES